MQHRLEYLRLNPDVSLLSVQQEPCARWKKLAVKSLKCRKCLCGRRMDTGNKVILYLSEIQSVGCLLVCDSLVLEGLQVIDDVFL